MRWLAIPLLLASFAISDPALAQLRGSVDVPPQFSAADRAVIARNELLRSVVEQDPALVRRALDALANLDDAQARTDMSSSSSPAAPSTSQPPSAPSSNPDLDRLDRASPEAMNDLFQLLKQAARGQRPSR
jgi:hypothetical protein